MIRRILRKPAKEVALTLRTIRNRDNRHNLGPNPALEGHYEREMLIGVLERRRESMKQENVWYRWEFNYDE